jgi:hypothetical protein
MATVQQIIDLARRPLNDADKTRYPDADALRELNQGMRQLRSKRADLFISTLTTAYVDLIVSDTLPLDDSIQQPLADYVTARLLGVDNEEKIQQKAVAFYTLFGSNTYGR